MSPTISQIREALNSGQIALQFDDEISSGEIINSGGIKTAYSVHTGWDIVKAHMCDTKWREFSIQLMEYIDGTYKNTIERNSVIDTLQLEDDHWDWVDKSVVASNDQYRWFFIFSEGLPQAACVIYHPKASAFSKADIFYIEFVAVAPWNRLNPMAHRRFKGMGTLILKSAAKYAMENLNLTPGFSLHSLPQAAHYYEKIGMTEFEKLKKGVLAYYEMPQALIADFLSAA